ncbi:MAG: pyruvate, water dikinase regulatory protein [Planctomycetota bacterium]
MVDAAPNVIYVVSDGRGQTCTKVLQAALVQFDGRAPEIHNEAQVSTPEQVQAIVEKAAAAHALVFFTLVEDATRRAMRAHTARLGVPAVDVLGPALAALHDLLLRDPQAKAGLLYSTMREDFDRHDAIDYTLKHDDGRRPDGLSSADVVLVGVSRATKSSTCFYLAYHGIKAANVPIVPGVALPPQLLAVEPTKVIGLWINPSRLRVLRQARAQKFQLGENIDYLDRDAVSREVRQARQVMEDHGWRMVDASYMAVEEVARDVMMLLGRPGPGIE